MPTPDKILMRKIKKREKKKLKLINQKNNGVSEDNAGNITSCTTFIHETFFLNSAVIFNTSC